MRLKDRYRMAKASHLTPIGRVVLLVMIGWLTTLPVKISPNFFHVADMAPGLANVIISNAVGISLFIAVIIISTIVIGIIFGVVIWVLSGHYIMDDYIELISNILSSIGAAYKLLFGDYSNKWYFLKEIFHPQKIAKELLEKKY